MAINKYHGITYSKILANKLGRWFYKKFRCPKGIHLLDECLSCHHEEDGNPNHTLYCDACGITIGISEIISEEEACRRVNAYYDKIEKEDEKLSR